MSEGMQLALGLSWLALSVGAAILGFAGLLRAMFRRKPSYIYGRVFRPDDDYSREPVRLDTHTGRVQFVLWKAGEQGHTEDYWHDMGPGWEELFIPNQQQAKPRTGGIIKGEPPLTDCWVCDGMLHAKQAGRCARCGSQIIINAENKA